MRKRRYSRYKNPQPKKPVINKPLAEIVRELKETSKPPSSYREQSLKIHSLVCAKCGREFDYKTSSYCHCESRPCRGEAISYFFRNTNPNILMFLLDRKIEIGKTVSEF